MRLAAWCVNRKTSGNVMLMIHGRFPESDSTLRPNVVLTASRFIIDIVVARGARTKSQAWSDVLPHGVTDERGARSLLRAEFFSSIARHIWAMRHCPDRLSQRLKVDGCTTTSSENYCVAAHKYPLLAVSWHLGAHPQRNPGGRAVSREWYELGVLSTAAPTIVVSPQGGRHI